MRKLTNVGILVLIFILGTDTSVLAQTNHPFGPAPIYSNLLNSVFLRRNNEFKPVLIYGYYLTNAVGKLRVLRNGVEIAEYTFRSPRWKPGGAIYEMGAYQLAEKTRDGYSLYLKEGGKYELAYYTAGKKFYSFPFEIVVKPSGDPYNPKERLLLNGAWNDHAYLARTSEEAHGTWEFRVWVRSDDGKYKQSKGNIRVIRDSDKKLVAVGRTNFRQEADWKRQTFTLEKPGKQNSEGEYYSNMAFLANRDKFGDGSYTLSFNADGQLYGAYKFTVKSGEIQYQGKQIRESTNPLHFIEGGGNHFWLKKQ